jgi:glutamate/tyrosine decarboxylase-like PLP-dependent enzyme
LASPEEIHEKFAAAGVPLSLLGEQSCVSQEMLQKAVDLVLEYSVRTGHPLFFNQLYARGHPSGIAADWVSAATNSNCHTYEVAPVYTVMEKETLAKTASVVGGDYANGHDGLFVPGGSISNIYGMHLAHIRADPNFLKRGAVGGPRCVAFTSDQSHYSYLKSARLTGLGSDNLISIESDGQGRLQPEALEAAILKTKEEGGLPFFVGTTAGTTVLGAYDPFDKIADICQKYGMWQHVDGCWGGSVMLSAKHRHLVTGLNRADSLAWNPHKMMGAPLQCSIFLTKHEGILAQSNGTNAAYLFQPDKLHTSLDTGDKTIQCGRKTDMFKLWLMWKAIGDAGFEKTVDHCFEIASVMAKTMREDSSGAWKLVYEPSCTNVCFWYIPEKLRPFDFSKATKEQRAWLHRLAPLIKTEMQQTGDALIGYQSVNGRPNFFRIVFASADSVTHEDVTSMMGRIASMGEKHAASLGPVDP